MVRASNPARGTAAKPTPRTRGSSDAIKRDPAAPDAADAVEVAAKAAVSPAEVERPAAKGVAAEVATAQAPAAEAPVSKPAGAAQEPKQDDPVVAAAPKPAAAVSEPVKPVDPVPEAAPAEAPAAKPAGTNILIPEPVVAAATAQPAAPKAAAPKAAASKLAVSRTDVPERAPSGQMARKATPSEPRAVKAPIREPLTGGSVAAKTAAVRSKSADIAKPPRPEPAVAGVAALQGITVGYWQEQLERTMTAGRAMMLCRSPEEAIRLQLGYVQGSLVSGIDRIGDVTRWSQAALRETLLPR